MYKGHRVYFTTLTRNKTISPANDTYWAIYVDEKRALPQCLQIEGIYEWLNTLQEPTVVQAYQQLVPITLIITGEAKRFYRKYNKKAKELPPVYSKISSGIILGK